MLKRTIATLMSAALISSALAGRPAAADNYDVARTIALIAGLAVVGKIINDRKDDREAARVVTRQQHVAPPTYNIKPRPLPHRAQVKDLPGDCMRRFDTSRGPVTMFGRRCLENSFYNVNKLPDQCGMRVRTQYGPRFGYEARCLRDRGYKLARR